MQNLPIAMEHEDLCSTTDIQDAVKKIFGVKLNVYWCGMYIDRYVCIYYKGRRPKRTDIIAAISQDLSYSYDDIDWKWDEVK